MQPSVSPRHPWKALAAVIAMFALVHGALPDSAPHGHLLVTHWNSGAGDCPDINVHIEDADPDGPVIDVFDADDWS